MTRNSCLLWCVAKKSSSRILKYIKKNRMLYPTTMGRSYWNFFLSFKCAIYKLHKHTHTFRLRSKIYFKLKIVSRAFVRMWWRDAANEWKIYTHDIMGVCFLLVVLFFIFLIPTIDRVWYFSLFFFNRNVIHYNPYSDRSVIHSL